MRTPLLFTLLVTLLLALSTPAAAQSRAQAEGPRVQVSAASPNPFTSATRFTVTVEKAQQVTVELYNLLGQRVAELYTGPMDAGESRVFTIEADGLPAGLYAYRVQTGSTVVSRQVALLR